MPRATITSYGARSVANGTTRAAENTTLTQETGHKNHGKAILSGRDNRIRIKYLSLLRTYQIFLFTPYYLLYYCHGR